MNEPDLDALSQEDLSDLEEIIATEITPVQPPAWVRGAILATVAIPEGSTTISAAEGVWLAFPHPGIRTRKLWHDRERKTVSYLIELQPGASAPAHGHTGAEECFVIAGSCRFGAVKLEAGDHHRVEKGSKHGTVVSDTGCTMFIIADEADYHAA